MTVTVEQLRVERLARWRTDGVDHDHRVTPCDRLHYQFWASPAVEPLTREFIAERFADRVARERASSAEYER